MELTTGDGGPATEAGLNVPTNVAAGSDGESYILEWEGGVVRRVGRDGIITTIASRQLRALPPHVLLKRIADLEKLERAARKAGKVFNALAGLTLLPTSTNASAKNA